MLQNLPQELTMPQALEVLQVHRHTLRAWIESGKVETIDEPLNKLRVQRRYRFSRDYILSLLSDEEQAQIKP